MKVLITGVAGLLGANFSRHLLQKGYEVIGVDDLSGGYKENVPKECHFYPVNLCNDADLQNIFKEHNPDYVYHFAAYAAVCLSPFIRKYNYQNNIIASANLINCCINHGVKKLVFTSSMDVYGNQSPPFTEAMGPLPEDPYGIAKYAIEMDIKNAGEQFGLNYSIVRPHNVVGVYQNIWDKYRNVIGIWIRQTIKGEPITIYGDGTQIRAFSDIGYYMDPFEKLMSSCDGEILNIGADKYFSINELADTFQGVAESCGYLTNRVYLEKRNEVHTAYCDHSKAKRLLGFEDNTNLAHLIYDMFVWAKDQPNRKVQTMNYEIEKNMYSYWKK